MSIQLNSQAYFWSVWWRYNEWRECK